LVRAASRRRDRRAGAQDHGARAARGVPPLLDGPRVPRPPQGQVAHRAPEDPVQGRRHRRARRAGGRRGRGLGSARMADATYVLADIAGFTALTEAHGDEEALALVEAFTDVVRRELPHVDGEHVKTIGDALMLRIPAPDDAIRLGIDISQQAWS